MTIILDIPLKKRRYHLSNAPRPTVQATQTAIGKSAKQDAENGDHQAPRIQTVYPSGRLGVDYGGMRAGSGIESVSECSVGGRSCGTGVDSFGAVETSVSATDERARTSYLAASRRGTS